ncbi:MAG: hypothetical protein ACHP7P_00995 [Terriglobales bacterium]
MKKGCLDRNPYHHIPPDFQERSKSWIASAENLVSETAPFIYFSVENLMFAERLILQMEKTLERSNEPLLLKECAAHSILWLFGLYEVTRILRNRDSDRFGTLHKKLEVLRIPLGKHLVAGWKNNNKPHYPTSVWCPETGKVGWQAFNPHTSSREVYFRADLADEFLTVTK